MSDEQRDQAAAAALGMLPADELARLEADAVRVPELAAELVGHRATVSALEGGVAREAPPAVLFEKVLARIEEERLAAPLTSTAPAARPPRRSRVRRAWPAFAAGAVTAAAATAAAATVLVFVLAGDDVGEPEARAAVAGTQEFPGVRGEARLYDVQTEGGTVAIDLADVPEPAPGEHYEVWVLRKVGEGEMEAVGVFQPTASDIELTFTLPGPGDYEAVDISVEPDGGPAGHSGRSLAGGAFDEVT